MIRTLVPDVLRYGDYSRLGESIYDHPFQWGSKRTGPDLAREGGKYPHAWHYDHLMDPRQVSVGSIMPAYPWLEKDPADRYATAQDVLAREHVVKLVSFGPNNEGRALFRCAPVQGGAAEQAVGPGIESGKLHMGLAVAAAGDFLGAQWRRRLADFNRPQLKRDLDARCARVVGAQGANPRGHRLTAAVLHLVQVDAQKRERGVAHQPANRAFPEALERAAVVARGTAPFDLPSDAWRYP